MGGSREGSLATGAQACAACSREPSRSKEGAISERDDGVSKGSEEEGGTDPPGRVPEGDGDLAPWQGPDDSLE